MSYTEFLIEHIRVANNMCNYQSDIRDSKNFVFKISMWQSRNCPCPCHSKEFFYHHRLCKKSRCFNGHISVAIPEVKMSNIMIDLASAGLYSIGKGPINKNQYEYSIAKKGEQIIAVATAPDPMIAFLMAVFKACLVLNWIKE